MRTANIYLHLPVAMTACWYKFVPNVNTSKLTNISSHFILSWTVTSSLRVKQASHKAEILKFQALLLTFTDYEFKLHNEHYILYHKAVIFE